MTYNRDVLINPFVDGGILMALITMNFLSMCLGNNVDVNIIVPECPYTEKPADFYKSGKKYPVLWLLHGTFGDYTDWIRKSLIDLYASERDLIVVMPSAMNSNYANWPAFGTGYNMYDFLFDELMPMVYGYLPASDKREDNFIAGLSMGGRGTCVYALNHPEKFGGACILSAVPSDFTEMKKAGGPMWERMKKSAINFDSEEDFIHSYQNTIEVLKKQMEDKAELPRLLFGCGEEDSLYAPFLSFRKEAEKLGLKADFFSVPGMKHEWRFWDQGIEYALDYFGIRKKT